MKRLACLAWLGILAAVGCDSPLVDAECRSGFSLCAGACVDLSADFRDCGNCGHGCGRFVCDQGVCDQSKLHPIPTDDGSDSGVTLDFDPQPGLAGCGLGQQSCGGQCIDPASDALHCGACDSICDRAQVCAAGSCTETCSAPLTACDGRCFDLNRSPEHCGSCATHCSSGICESGVCAGAIAGQVVVIGHDFLSANNAMQRLAGNAVFLARGAPVHVLSYRGDASPDSVSGVENAIDVVKRELGRDWQNVDAIEALLPLQLAAADVLLIHAQAGASNSALSKLGAEWGNALAQFVVSGGVIVLFDTPTPNNDGTFRILAPAHIFAAAGRAILPDQELRVQAPGLGVAVRVPDRYMSARNSVHFSAVTTPGTFVVSDKDNLPVVLQRVIVPGE
jgi:hypothetical protein